MKNHEVEIDQWGYHCGPAAVQSWVWPVRVKPGITLALVLAGYGLNLTWLLVVTGVAGLIGTAWPNWSWIDLLYNHIIRKPFGAPELPEDPAPRRLMCGMADGFVLLSGLALAKGLGVWAAVFAGLVVLLAGVVVFTGICLPLFTWHLFRRRRTPFA